LRKTKSKILSRVLTFGIPVKGKTDLEEIIETKGMKAINVMVTTNEGVQEEQKGEDKVEERVEVKAEVKAGARVEAKGEVKAGVRVEVRIIDSIEEMIEIVGIPIII